jgi:hypothetical protein
VAFGAAIDIDVFCIVTISDNDDDRVLVFEQSFPVDCHVIS